MNNKSVMQEVPSIFWETKLKMKMGTEVIFAPHSSRQHTLAQVALFTTIRDIPHPSPTLSTKEDTDDANAIREKGTIDLYIIHVHTSAFITVHPPTLYCTASSEKGVTDVSIPINFSLTGLTPSQ